MAVSDRLLSYNFTHYITVAELSSRQGFERTYDEPTTGDKWKMEFQHEAVLGAAKTNRIVVTLTGKPEGDCNYLVKLSLLDENRLVKLELVKKGWTFVGSNETFLVPYQLLLTLISGKSKLVAVNISIIKIPKPSKAAELSTLFKSVSFGEVEVESGDGEKFYCHKGILSAKSSIFATMFNAGMKEAVENRVRIKDFNSDVISALLRFVYLGDWGDISGVAERLYVAADRYRLDQLKLACAADLIVNLNVESIVSTLRLAQLHKDESLMAGCVDYMASHKDQLSLVDVMAEAHNTQVVGGKKRKTTD